MINIEKKFISGTLDFGIKLPKWFFVTFLSSATIGFLASFVPFLIFLITDIYLEATIALGILATVFLCMVVITLIILFRQNKFFNKEITMFLNDADAVELSTVPWEFSSEGLGPYKKIKLAMRFRYKNSKLLIVSKRYDKKFLQYAGKETSIIYSPTYNQVIILK